ncbi:MAG TPA: thioredoxin family protein, partial [Saprospiraceae bacterium]|nr:thioredoxin family protein [Saprospiraceae bacterium]
LTDASLKNVKFAEVDKDKNAAIISKYPVSGQPVMIIYKDNVERERLSGIHPKEHMADLLKKLNP